MGKPYSLDLRERILAFVETGHSCRAAARVFGVSASTAVRLAAAQREPCAWGGRQARRAQDVPPGDRPSRAGHHAQGASRRAS